jgi:hypothetical protein
MKELLHFEIGGTEKLRLFAMKYTQTYVINYEAFASVANMNTVKIILSMASHFGWELQQFNVKNTFLHTDLEEEVYMEIPPGYYFYYKDATRI